MMNLRLFFLAILTFPLFASALPGDGCDPQQVIWGQWIFNRQYTLADGCLVQVTPLDKNGLVYREYVFDQSGRWMIFDSLDGPFETSTAQRNYFVLPARQLPRFERRENLMIVTTASGTEARFSPDSRFMHSSSSDLIFEEEQIVSLKPEGHFRIVRYFGTLLDTGWKLGDRAYRNREGTSSFLKVDSPACTFRNSDLFAYSDPLTREEYYQPVFKYSDPEALKNLIETYCSFPKGPLVLRWN